MSVDAVSALQMQDLEASPAARYQSVSSQGRLLGPFPGSQTVALRDVSRAVTVITAAVVILMFLFGFGNVLSLALRLEVPVWVGG
jgi:hypothetical protein